MSKSDFSLLERNIYEHIRSYFEQKDESKYVWSCKLCNQILKGHGTHQRYHLTSKHTIISKKLGLQGRKKQRKISL